ncbi:MAG TPA: glycine cleavage T C-terminal barrel domain-containing protein [Pirellulales bacterium]|nr:glycine cleavage T C-terminal barrel domain-containing protein [Pirellulales bacterium]
MPDAASLNDALRAAGAVFGAAVGGDQALHFGDAAAEYDALAKAAGLVDLSARTRIELSGEDRAAFLHNLCTNEIRKLPPGAGCEAFLADARGHVLFHVFVVCRPESLLVETMPGDEARLLAHLDRYLIREKVTLAARSQETSELLVAGPNAAEILARLASVALPEPRLGSAEIDLAGCQALVVRTELIGAGGFLVIGDRADGERLWRALHAAGARPCGFEALETARIEAGFPWYGIDISDKNLPQEVGRDELAISFVKGCYLGQETVARIDALGHVNKLLVGVKFAGDGAPTAGAELKAAEQTVGEVASACYSPRFQAPLALAYVRRGHNEPGARLESSFGAAEVVKLPGA